MSSRIYSPASQRSADVMLSVLRIMAALVLMQHGTQKFFGFPVPSTPPQPYHLLSLNGIAAILESFGGLAILLGFLTRPVAFLLAGEMAVAYFHIHAKRGFWPIVNRGELAIMLCFVFLYLVFAGAGSWSIDALIAGRDNARTAERPRPSSTTLHP